MLFVFLCVLGGFFPVANARVDPELHMTTPQLVEHWGYPAEQHWVTTTDGYILGMHRIPAGKGHGNHGNHGNNGNSGRAAQRVVFLQHGLLDSSATWVLNPPEQSFGFILAEAGYDVWLGNVRGNTYSTNHTTLSPKSPQFWDFSFDEMAAVDLPAMISYVIQQTGAESLSYFGHSQGTEIAWIELSRNQAIASKVNFFGAFAPVARITHVEGFFKVLNQFAPELQEFFTMFGIHDFIPSNWLMHELAALVCPLDQAVVCRDVIFLICGWDLSNLNETRVPVYVAHTPAGTSVKNVLHWSQMIRAGQMQMYDYGPKGNLAHYNSSLPPAYDITGMSVPVALVAGGNDFLGDPRDVDWLEGQLDPRIIKANIFYDDYNHLDFVWGMDANVRVYGKMLTLLDHISN